MRQDIFTPDCVIKSHFQLGELTIISGHSTVTRDTMSILHGKRTYHTNLIGEVGIIIDIEHSIIHAGTGRDRIWWYRVLTSRGTFWVTGMNFVRYTEKLAKKAAKTREMLYWRYE